MNKWDVPELVFDPEQDPVLGIREDCEWRETERKYNSQGVKDTLAFWVPWFPHSFSYHVSKNEEWGRVGLQPESLQGLVFPTEEACLDAMERYAKALDPWNRYIVFGSEYDRDPYTQYGHRGDWLQTPERRTVYADFRIQYDDENGEYKAESDFDDAWDARALEVRTKREPGKLTITAKWEEKLPPDWGWHPVEWIHDGERVSERFIVHTARRLEIYWGA